MPLSQYVINLLHTRMDEYHWLNLNVTKWQSNVTDVYPLSVQAMTYLSKYSH